MSEKNSDIELPQQLDTNDSSQVERQLSCTPDSPDGHDRSEDMVPRSQLQKVIRQRQQAKQYARQLSRRLAALDGADESSADTSKAFDSDGDEGPNISSSASDEVFDELSSLRRQLSRSRSQLADMVRSERIKKTAAEAGAINPEQVVSMLKERVLVSEADDGSIKVSCFDSSGELMTDDNGKPVGVDKLVGQFLSDTANANLLLPTAVAASGVRVGGFSPSPDSANISLSGFNNLSPAQRRKVALSMDRTQRERMLGLSRSSNMAYL